MTDQWVDELFDETENFMTFLRLHMKKLLTGATLYVPPARSANSALPTLSGNAVQDDTLTATPGTWSNSPTDYDRVWQIATDSPNFTQWSDIADSKVLTYVVQAGDVDAKLRYGERALNLGGWSAWAYSAPTGIVIDTTPPVGVPTINAAGYFTDVGGGAIPSPLYVGDTIEIQEANVSDATGVWYYLVRDGVPVDIQPIASDQDTFPVAYVVNAEDIGTAFELQTVASNAAGSVNALSADIGPIAYPPGSGSFIDLGSRQATEDFILANAPAEWTQTGTATWSQTATSAAQLVSLLNTVKGSSLTGRYEITCDWDGISFNGTELTTLLYIQGPAGTTGWADNGGWLHLKAASGKRPAIGNRVVMNNCRGLYVEGVDFAGKYSGSGQLNGQYCIWVQRNATYNAPAKIVLKDQGVGRYFRDNTEPSTNFIHGIVFAGGMCDQLTLDGSAIHGTDLGIKGPCRLLVLRNTDQTLPQQDFTGLREYVETGFHAYVIADHSVVRSNLTSFQYATRHKDCLQTGRTPNALSNSDVHLGYRMILKNSIWHAEHYYAGTQAAGGGSQGSYNDDHYSADNLFALYNTVILCSTVHAFAYFGPSSRHTSYGERCTLGPCGRRPSQFSPDTGAPQDYSPGVTFMKGVDRTGTAVKFVDSLIGCKYDAQKGFLASAQFPGTVVVNYTATSYSNVPQMGITSSDPSPEDVFNGRDFTRGGAAEANSIPNKFGYLLPNEGTLAGFVSDIAANFTPQGAYASKGATITPANYTAVTPPTGGG